MEIYIQNKGDNMNIKTIKVGCLNTNCYILEKDNKCLVIDPGDEIDKILANIKYEVVGILLTHRHFDHVGALSDLVKYSNATVYDYDNLKEGINIIEPFTFLVIYTPGHTKDSISFYFKEDKVMFTGDFLFHGDTGRTDLLTGSDEDMRESIDKIKKYDDNIKIYPGHEESSTLGEEKKNNISF